MKQNKYFIIISLLLFFVSFFIYPKVLLFIAYILMGFPILHKAFRNLLRLQWLDENFLMSIATIGALYLGEFHEAVGVMLFYQIGLWFQNKAVNQSRDNIAQLMDLRPETLTRINDDQSLEVIEGFDLEIDDLILVKPGEKVGCDGIVFKGNSTLDMSALTGESLPIQVAKQDTILSGSVNLSGMLEIKATKTFNDSTVSKILDLIENASNYKSKTENFMTRFARYYTPFVVISALILAFIIPLFIGNFNLWFSRSLNFLVVSCPCALVISIPLSFFGGIGNASRQNVLIKGSSFLEALSQVETIVFDKTGTLTQGAFKIQDIVTFDHFPKEKAIYLAAMVEHFSNHPLATIIKNHYQDTIDSNRIRQFHEESGLGTQAIIDNHTVIAGNYKWLTQHNIKTTAINSAHSVVYLAVDQKHVASFLMSDALKGSALETIKHLRSLHIKNIHMLTGDQKKIAHHVAQTLKLDQTFSQLLPFEKTNIIQTLKQETSKTLVFVGDGLNDAPALAMSDVGISMGELGADAALEAADIILMHDRIEKIPQMIYLAKQTMSIVFQNITIALATKFLIMLLSIGGLVSMWHAIFGDVGVTLIAIFNALRVLYLKPKHFQ